MNLERIEIRPATLDDMRFVWEINNDESVRSQAVNQEPIPWDSHQLWFQNRLDSHESKLWILTVRDEDFGVVRFDLTEAVAEITIAVHPSHRGQGLGSRAIRLASEEILAAERVDQVLALVRPSNPASVKAFEKAGYRKNPERLERGGVVLEQLTFEE